MSLSDSAHLPPLITLPAGSKPITNKAGHFVVLNPYAATKLRYWTIFMRHDGTIAARFNKNNEVNVEKFGSYVLIHLHPFNPDSPPRLTVEDSDAG